MLIFVLALLVGVFVGTVSGLFPGIHINLVSSVLPLLASSLGGDPLVFVVFVVSLAMTHTFVDFIPSVFLGAPNEDTAVAVLPGHRFLLAGQGHYAVKLALVGGLVGVGCLVVVVPLLFLFLEQAYTFFDQMMAFFLVWVLILMIVGEGKLWFRSLMIVLLAGAFGFASLGLELHQPLLPMFSGLFGASSLVLSLKLKTKIPPQEKSEIPLIRSDIIKPSLAALIVSPICAILPGLGSSQAAVIGSRLVKRMNHEEFFMLLGAVNTLVMGLSFFVLVLLSKSRTGAAAAVGSLVSLSSQHVLLLCVVIFFSSILAAMFAFLISRRCSLIIGRIDYSKVSLGVIVFLVGLVFVMSGFLGLLVFLAGSLIGLVCSRLGVRKSFLMACLLLPTISYYLPW